jgi:hypothetical protein
MTQEDKELLLKDLCARLPYGVIVNYKEDEYDFHKWKIEILHAPAYSESGLLIKTNSDGWIGYTEYKGCGMSSASRALHLDKNLPYLRPMSSMTEEEKLELVTLYLARDKRYRKDLRIKETEFFLDSCWYVQIVYKDENDKEVISAVYIGRGSYIEEIDWLNAHHFDYRGLIEKGIALEAPKGMYESKK